MIYIYCHHISPRIRYISQYLERIFGHQVCPITALDGQYDGAVLINYTRSDMTIKHISVYNAGLLEQSQITPLRPSVTDNDDFIKLYPSDSDSSIDLTFDIDFDLLSAVFYCISRYEEYLPFTPDVHGRFCADQSWMHLYDILEIPIVDIWITHLKEQLMKAYPQAAFKDNQFSILPTIDIDIAWAYSQRSTLSQSARLAKSILALDLDQAKIIGRSLGQVKDPFDTFEKLNQLLKNHRSVYFWLMKHQLPHDTAYYIDHEPFHRLVQSVASYSEIGIHPSYNSYLNPVYISSEKQKLEAISSLNMTKSRQHYLRLSLPESYRQLITLGIKEEYSMGYAGVVGFRAGTSFAFPFYDLQREVSTDLLVHPFQVMDVTLKEYLKLKPEAAIKKIASLKAEIKLVGGQFSFIWHNSSFHEGDGWHGWDKVLVECLKKE